MTDKEIEDIAARFGISAKDVELCDGTHACILREWAPSTLIRRVRKAGFAVAPGYAESDMLFASKDGKYLASAYGAQADPKSKLWKKMMVEITVCPS